MTREDTHTPAAEQPLAITITDAGRENLVLRVLVRQAIPILKHPEGHSRAERLQLAQTLATALQIDDSQNEDELPPAYSDADVPPEEPEAYERGCDTRDPWE